MTSTTSDPRSRSPLGLSPTTWALVVSIVLGMVFAGVAIGLLMRDREAARQDADAVAGQSKQLVECVRDPATTTSECQQQADQVEETIDDTKAGAAGRDGTDGAAGAVGRDGTEGQDGTDGRDGAAGRDGARGPRGPRGFIGPVGPAGQPGADGAAGSAGADGATGPAGPIGPQGATGDRGASGAAGSNGADGADGRGIRSISCDPDTQQFVVTYTDETSQPVQGSDCVASQPAPVPLP